ncbi:MAG: F0F1 ATP synthase subunit epsilon [Caldilineaceae bacterium]|nr:F0F1 ATP synthase subunit epsilon [Caldilineaceae bacterium]MCB0139730.1 F0F1 ATP synthase subunit epsilon [Caldilineaceae bacterium]
MTIHVEIVAPDKTLFSGDVQMVTLPGLDGQMGVMGGHAPLLTTLGIGEIVLHGANETEFLAVSGGVVEVRPNKVTILADVAEAADEIDEERAQEALARAQQSLADNPPAEHRAPLLESVRRSSLRLRVARKRRRAPRAQFQSSEE